MRSVLKAELLKWRRTPVLFVTIAATLAVPLLVVLQLSHMDPPISWDLLLGNILIIYVTLTGPLIVTLIGAQSIAVEYQCDTWKTVLATATPRWQVLLGKWCVGCVWIVGLTALVALASWPASRLLNIGESLDVARWAATYGAAGIGLTAMLPAYQLVTLLFRSFFVTSGVGIVGTIVAFFVLSSKYAGLYPITAVTILASRISQHLEVTGLYGTTELWIGILAVIALGSLLVGIVRIQTADIH